MSERIYGAKYQETRDLNRTQIAALIRTDIKAAVADGRLPKGKYSVKTENWSMGGAIEVRIREFSRPFLTLEYVAWYLDEEKIGFRGGKTRPVEHTAEGKAALYLLRVIMDSYNYDGSDSQSDHFDVRFYGHPEFASELHAQVIEAYRELVEA